MATTAAAFTRIARIVYAAGDKIPACQARDKASCPKHHDLAVYRVERINPDTGEVWSCGLCLNAVAAWAARHQCAFPPPPAGA